MWTPWNDHISHPTAFTFESMIFGTSFPWTVGPMFSRSLEGNLSTNLKRLPQDGLLWSQHLYLRATSFGTMAASLRDLSWNQPKWWFSMEKWGNFPKFRFRNYRVLPILCSHKYQHGINRFLLLELICETARTCSSLGFAVSVHSKVHNCSPGTCEKVGIKF